MKSTIRYSGLCLGLLCLAQGAGADLSGPEAFDSECQLYCCWSFHFFQR